MGKVKKTGFLFVIYLFFLASCDSELGDSLAADSGTESDFSSDDSRLETDPKDTDTGSSAATENQGDSTDTTDGTDTDNRETDHETDTDTTSDTESDATDPQTVSSSFRVRASIEQIHVWLAHPGVGIEVVNSDGIVVSSETTDYQGSLVFRDVLPGKGYTVRLAEFPNDFTDQLHVMTPDESLPDESFYASQILEPGYGYITTRDGTTLSIFVSLPGPIEDGPYPTLINYSGYAPSSPGKPVSNLPTEICTRFPVLCDAPNHASGLIGGVMGYATVGVNMRGTGCSGGAYDYFDTPQLLDGYDAVEIVARQSWVKHNKVGMSGLSYPGISQLFVASTQPPSLAAITPLSVIADSYSSTMAPGGIPNDGFALSWIESVLSKAEPYGQGWEQQRVDEGDLICEENQLLHSQKRDILTLLSSNSHYSDALTGHIDPTTFVHKIQVPVFLTGQWQDEQTGPHFAALFDKFSGSSLTRFNATNGIHMDGFAPQFLVEWKAFLDLYVSREVPHLEPIIYGLAPLLFSEAFRSPMELPLIRFAEYTEYEAAREAYEAEKPLRIVFDSGAHPDEEQGVPRGTFDLHFDSWPIPGTQALRLYFHGDGGLRQDIPEDMTGASSFLHDKEAGNRVTLNSGPLEDLLPNYNYAPLLEGRAVAFVSDPLEDDLIMAGHGSVDLFLQSTALEADLEVSLTEVRPDGQEMYVQSGWLRASHRALSSEATELRPVKTHREEDSLPLVLGEWNDVQIEIMPFSHVFRAGSRIRLSIDTPGDSCVRWKFRLTEYETDPVHSIAHNNNYPSSVVLPVIDGIEPPEMVPDSETETPLGLPPCPSLRGQPCRPYVPFVNMPFQ